MNTAFAFLCSLGVALWLGAGLVLALQRYAQSQHSPGALGKITQIHSLRVLGDTSHNSVFGLRSKVLPHLQDNFFTLDLQQARAAFEALPWVRHAVVKRSFSSGFANEITVVLEEHQPVAFWGESSKDGTQSLVNRFGEVFEASAGEAEDEDSIHPLPRLGGPDKTAQDVWQTYQALNPVFAHIGARLQSLGLTEHGSWRAELLQEHSPSPSAPAWVELGRGPLPELLQRAQAFVASLPQLRPAQGGGAFLSADLRHHQGFALRWPPERESTAKKTSHGLDQPPRHGSV